MDIQLAYSKLRKFYYDFSMWVKFIFLFVFLVLIGVVLFYIFGKNKAIIRYIRRILNGFGSSIDRQKNAVLVNKKDSDLKINYDSLNTGKVISDKISSIDRVLSQL
jgi:hypothetical protein